MPKLLLSLLLIVCTGTAAAHEINHVVAAVNAVSVSLTYADGSPFAYEKYELYAQGKSSPVQVGKTDDYGRVTFMADDVGQWRLKAYSADGHGIDFRFASPAALQPNTSEADKPVPNRLSLMLFGLGLILSIFGLYQLLGRKK